MSTSQTLKFYIKLTLMSTRLFLSYGDRMNDKYVKYLARVTVSYRLFQTSNRTAVYTFIIKSESRFKYAIHL